MHAPDERTECQAIRHDLKNVFTALRHGCKLVAARIDEPSHREVHEFLSEMQTAVDQGSELVERLRGIDVAAVGSDRKSVNGRFGA